MHDDRQLDAGQQWGADCIRGRDDLRNRLPLWGRLSNARIWLIVKTAVRGVYVTDIDIRPVVKPAARIGSGIGIPDHRCAAGEQHRQANGSQSYFEVAHRSVPRHESPYRCGAEPNAIRFAGRR